MSQANVERVQRAIAAFNRGDIDTAVAGMHPEVEWQPLDLLPDVETYRGPEGVQEFWRAWQTMFRGFRLDIETCEAVADDQVLAHYRVCGEGTGSGAAVVSPRFFQLFEFRDEQLIRARMFQTRQGALTAAGLPE